jgi:hypothetical protein
MNWYIISFDATPDHERRTAAVEAPTMTQAENRFLELVPWARTLITETAMSPESPHFRTACLIIGRGFIII